MSRILSQDQVSVEGNTQIKLKGRWKQKTLLCLKVSNPVNSWEDFFTGPVYCLESFWQREKAKSSAAWLDPRFKDTFMLLP